MTAATKTKPHSWQPHDGSEHPAGNISHSTTTSRMEGDLLTVTESITGKTGTRTYYWYYDLVARLRSTSGCLNDAVKAPMTDWEADWILAKRMPVAVSSKRQQSRSNAWKPPTRDRALKRSPRPNNSSRSRVR